MMKFWSFEATVAAIYNALGKPKSEYNKVEQLGVSAAAGYFAGIFCAVVSHPADTMVSSKSLKHSAPSRSRRSFSSDSTFGGEWWRSDALSPIPNGVFCRHACMDGAKCKNGAERGTDSGSRAPAELNAPLKPGQAKPTVGTIYSEIGFGGLWSGLGTRILMVGTLTALQWVRRFRRIEPQRLGRFCSLPPPRSSSTTRSRSPWVSRPLVRPLRTPPRSKRRLDRDALPVLLPHLVVPSSPTRVFSPYLFKSNVPILESFTTSTPPPPSCFSFRISSLPLLHEKMSTELFCSNWSCGLLVCGRAVCCWLSGWRALCSSEESFTPCNGRRTADGGLIADQSSPPRPTRIGRSSIPPGTQ